jgi:uncharacterized protein YyaL (SSP411 family)
MEWREWSEEAFAAARRDGRPVLLFLKASWCRWCRELEREVLADPRVERLLADHFVSVRVDKDRRPDIDARYSQGGWPTLAWLDDSGELITADAYLEADDLVERLQLIAGYWAENRETIRRRLAETAERSEREALRRPDGGTQRDGDAEIVEWVARTVLGSADPQWGGWGREHKFPHPEAIDFALIRWSQTGDEAMRKLVLRTLRNMQRGEIHDRVEGGFYRYATSPDWNAPHFEKVLDSNAQRLYAFLEAYQAMGEDSFRETARGILRWMEATLLDPATGAFRGSQDASPTYARLTTLEARRAAGAPACDPTIFANWNAMAVSALLKAATVLREPRWRERALGTLDFLLAELFDERAGVYHYWDGSYHLSGLLSDQAYLLRALVDAQQQVGGARYLEKAQVLAGLLLETLRSPSGAFWDVRHDPGARGGLRRRNLSILENAVAAEALLRLSHFTAESHYAEAACATLDAFRGEYKRYAHFVAGYARALDLLLHPPVHVTVVGRLGADDTRALQAAALAPYVASRIVQVIDPAEQPRLVERFGLPTPDDGAARAFVHRGRESYAETSDAARLPALMTRVERDA